MSTSAILQPSNVANRTRFGRAWLLFVLALGLHVTDEAVTGFLKVYNPTVLELHQRVPWLRPPVFGYGEWLTGLVVVVCCLLLLTPLAYEAPRVMKAFALPLGVIIGILNGCGHLTGTLLGHTFSDIRFSRPMPGTYSSPLLIAAGLNLLFALRGNRLR